MPTRIPWIPLPGAASGTSPAAWLPRLVRNVLARARLWAERARENRELAQCDDRLLRDMGLTRYDLAQEPPRRTRRLFP